MTEPNQEKAGVEVSGFGGTLKLFGGNSLFFFLLLVLALNIGVTLWEHVQRRIEHEQIMCSTKLAIFVYTTPRQPDGKVNIEWTNMDVGLYACVPSWLYKRN